jgi:hypothetical protein
MLPRRQVTSVDVERVHPELDVVADVGRGSELRHGLLLAGA